MDFSKIDGNRVLKLQIVVPLTPTPMSRSRFITAPVLAIALTLVASASLANNITVSNTSLVGQNVDGGFVTVQFNLSWENSWRTPAGPSNWDAAWVFVKWRVPVSVGGDGLWKHALLNDSGHTGTGATINPGLLTLGTAFSATTNPAVGVFVYRAANGSGTFSITGAQLRWNYGANGLSSTALVEVRVFAIEMVYVPQGSFNVGGGGGGYNPFTSTTINTGTATTVPSGTGALGGQAGGYPTGQTPPNVAWPNGYNAFYSMKYELSQGQYRDFLNTLTYDQQVNRTDALPNSPAGTGALGSNTARNGLDIQTPGNATTLVPAVYGSNLNGNTVYNEATDGEWIACNHLSWMDGAAYSDWAGLRPMTELEYEKASRGNQAAVYGEFAWGSTVITKATGISNGGANNETSSNAGANSVFDYNNIGGPLRVGAFAGAATTRVQAGATYYGIMEMTGNLWDAVVTIGNPTGRDFTGLHGDGELSANGHANQSLWPGISSNEVTGATGAGWRGGDLGGWNTDGWVSDRRNAFAGDANRYWSVGFRGVRTAP